MITTFSLIGLVMENQASSFTFNNTKQRVSVLNPHILESATLDSDLKLKHVVKQSTCLSKQDQPALFMLAFLPRNDATYVLLF